MEKWILSLGDKVVCFLLFFEVMLVRKVVDAFESVLELTASPPHKPPHHNCQKIIFPSGRSMWFSPSSRMSLAEG